MSKTENLKAKILEALKNTDIATMYILQDEAIEILNEETLNGFFANILDLALENLTNTLESCSTLEMNNVQDFATLRALYEYAMEHYHGGNPKDASALFEVLAGVTGNEAFRAALLYHQKASELHILLDDFLDNYADMQATEINNTFYISSFTKKAQELLISSKESAE
jgi:hypothetical protein